MSEWLVNLSVGCLSVRCWWLGGLVFWGGVGCLGLAWWVLGGVSGGSLLCGGGVSWVVPLVVVSVSCQ